MIRRDFIRAASGVGAGLALSLKGFAASEAEGKRKRSANDRINVGLIGVKNLGGKVHLPSVVGSPECQLVGICDVDAKVAEEALNTAEGLYAEQAGKSGYKGIRTYGDFRELLQRKDLDAVMIATPDHWHVPIAKEAIRAGLDVYVEKPLSLHIEEGRELVELLKVHPRILQVGSQQRSQDRFIIASEFVRNGLLGEVKHVDVSINTRPGSAEKWKPEPIPEGLDYDMWLGPAPWSDYHSDRLHYNFRFMPEISGGEIANWGAHFLDTAQMGLGTDVTGPVSVRGMGQRNPVGARHTSYFDLDVDYEYGNGVTMKLRSGKNGVTFFGTSGQLYVNREELWTNPKDLIREYKGQQEDLAIRLRRTKGGHFQNWLACVRSRRAEDLHAPVEVGHRSATLCHLANISIDLGRPLYWNPERESFLDDAHANALRNRPARAKWSF
ncbi:Gfo/Idh/MocA family oxidoreductase [Pelagicoccus sp. SDUM812005]|uniref:Gfo/Idh/MocA family protein n=1 Tax=Pelagicoccus sp. SDUM812005 TaxID=3041257 RepID=UPI00280FFFCB|nr:Gfo/Idh/MocA family oxidoreductase [Pelagicoccus sp. SDUM812005]MDQ8180744.1 Gfo/Idh/MocA family oxidoreductase [Pelagicoccus sp. SDUM812005]